MFGFFPADATHIVGGEMNYTCLGNDEYEITLTIFRDCFYGNPNAWFDNPGSIGIFNADNEFLLEIQVPLMNNDTLQPTLSGECFVVPPDVCVHTTTYTTVVTLPPVIGGYQLSYQRCCRNQTIANIIDPLGTGATYGLTISEQALLECNSSPQFVQWPPLYICVDEPIVFDQSAIDADGDSIVYRLCAPLKGADPNSPQPQPPNPPPYDPVDWVDPPYGVDNMLNGIPGGVPLEINPETGLLTGLPNTIGQFVVGICIEEYRDGELISTTRRDFQYNVGVCGEWTASFFAPDVQCDGLEVTFDNTSLGADTYLWTFGDPANPDFVSTESFPVYTYPDTGSYLVTLIAGPDSPCVDTFQQEINLQPNTLFPDFEFSLESCSDSMVVQFTDTSIDSLFEITEWYWNLLQDENQFSSEQNPAFSIFESGVYTVELTVTSENGCEKTHAQAFFVNLINENLDADTLHICLGESTQLNTGYNAEYQYEWSPPVDFADIHQPDPVVMPSETTTYTVTVTDSDDFCQVERSITVVVPPLLDLELPTDTVICEPEFTLEAYSEGALFYEWASDINFDDIIASEAIVEVVPFGETTYYIRAIDANDCLTVDSVVIEGNGVNVINPDTIIACQGETPVLWMNNIDPTDMLSVQWEPVDQILSSPTGMTVTVLPEDVGINVFYVNAENQFGCEVVDSVMVFMVDTTSQEALITTNQCSDYTVYFSSESVNAPYFIWHFDDQNAPPGQMATGQEVAYDYSAAGIYEVFVTMPPALTCTDTLFFQVEVTEPQISVAFDWEFETCSDTAVIQFTDLSLNNQSTIIGWNWDFGNNELSNLQNPQSEYISSGEWDVTLEILSSDGCRDSITLPVLLEMVDEVLVDTIIICPGDSASLNPEQEGVYEYIWQPSESLSNPFSQNPIAAPGETTTYTATISNLNNICSIEQTVTAFVPPLITYDLSPDTILCDDNYLLFAESDQAVQYAWATDPDFTLFISGEQELLVPINESESTFYIRMTDEYDCRVEDVVNVSWHGINVELDDEETLCIGDTLMLEVLNLQPEELYYTWTPEELIIEGEFSANPLVNPTETTVFDVSIENDFGCTLDTFITVNIFDFVPPLDVTATPDTVLFGESSQLNATNGINYTYIWSPSTTLDNNTVFNPVATPEETTTYTIIVRDENGCINQALVTVYVLILECGEPYIFIPSGFTPDGDGLNDQLEVYGNNIAEMHLVIYNRWGEQVFESFAQSEKWDGTYNGKELPPGAFGFYLEVLCDDGESYVKKGNITLIR